MTEHLISMFIDNELDLDEKIEFVETVHADTAYKEETVDFISQEKNLRTKPVDLIPPLVSQPSFRWWRLEWLRPLSIGLSCGLAIVFLWMVFTHDNQIAVNQTSKSHRFVIYRPDVASAEITGSFTGWQPRTMHRIGDSGYWEAELQVPSGEHRFVYILDGSRRITDPTVSIREKDDFGGENSILSISS
jgi:hypothetical protein